MTDDTLTLHVAGRPLRSCSTSAEPTAFGDSRGPGLRPRRDRRRARRRRGRRLRARPDRRGAADDRLAAAVPERGRPLPAAHRGGGGRAREADRARRHGRQGADDHVEPAARRLDRPPLPDAGHHARRPDPGGRDRPDPRDGEVRLAQGLQVLDLRDLVDPPGGAARRRQQGAHHPHPGARRRARAEGRAHRARAVREARPPAERRGDREAREAPAQPGARGARGCPRGRLDRRADRRRRRHELRRAVRRRRPDDRGRGRRRRSAATPCAAPSRSCPTGSAT